MSSLSERKIRDTKPASADKWLGDGDGLWLRVRPDGTKTFVFRQKRSGKATERDAGRMASIELTAGAREYQSAPEQGSRSRSPYHTRSLSAILRRRGEGRTQAA